MIIIAAIALIVLVVVIVLVTGKTRTFGKTTKSCSAQGGYELTATECPSGEATVPGVKVDTGKICCMSLVGENPEGDASEADF